jgi:hypothetical protein
MPKIAREKYTTHEMRTRILSFFARYPRCYAMDGIAVFVIVGFQEEQTGVKSTQVKDTGPWIWESCPAEV